MTIRCRQGFRGASSEAGESRPLHRFLIGLVGMRRESWLHRLLFRSSLAQARGWRGWLLKPLRFGLLVAREFQRDLCFERAASLTYATILSLIPLAVLFFSFSDLIGQGDLIQNYVRDKVFPMIAPSAQIEQGLEDWLAEVSNQKFQEGLNSLVGFSALMVLIIVALGVVVTAERNFNRIWRTKSSRSYLQKFAVFWVILTISPFVLIASTQVGELLVPPGSSMESLIKAVPLLGVVYSFLLPLLLGLLGFSVVYLFLPSASVRFPSALLGGLVAACLWEGARRGFASYVRNADNIYGQLAIVPAFLIWIYLNWLVMLFGCVLTYVHQHRRLFRRLGQRRELTSDVPTAFVGAYLLERAARAYRHQGALPTASSIAEELRVRVETVHEAASLLGSAGFIAEVVEPQGAYALLRSPADFSLGDAVAVLPQEDFPQGLLKRVARPARKVGEEDLARGVLVAFQRAREVYLGALDGETLAETTRISPSSSPPLSAAIPESRPSERLDTPL